MSGFFNKFPLMYYDLTGDVNARPVITRNIFFRFKLRDAILNNAMVYYAYGVQDSDTPEIIAHKYYKDVTKGWLVLMANTIVDGQFDWVLNYDQFNKYINKKYGSFAIASSTVHHYNKVITKIDGVSGRTTQNKIVIDLATFTAMAATSFQVLNLKNGHDVTITTTKEAVYCLQYEIDLNETKRNIKLISADYISQIDQEFDEITKPKSLSK